MKIRMLVLLALACAVLVAAVGGTLAGYTDKAAFSFNIQPDVGETSSGDLQSTAAPQATANAQPAEDLAQESEAPTVTEAPAEEPSEVSETGSETTSAPQQTSDKEA